MNAKEIITDALKVYGEHCATQIAEKRKLLKGIPKKEQLEKIEEWRSIWKARFEASGTVLTRINKGEILGL